VLWQNLDKNGTDKDTQRKLQQYLQEKFTQRDLESLPAQLSHLLVQTASQQRELVFFPILSDIARQLAEVGNISLARQMYQILQKYGAGSFETQLAQLKKFDEVQEYINLAEFAETANERWELWSDAWVKYPGYPTLRQAIQAELSKTVTIAEREITKKLKHHQPEKAKQFFTALLENIFPVLEAWRSDPQISAQVWKLARQLFEAFIDLARREDNPAAYQHALQIIRLIPPSIPLSFSGDLYLEAIQSVAQHFEVQPGVDVLMAAALLEYGLFWIRHQRCAADQYTLSRVHENVARLLENVGFLDRAYFHAQQAHKQAITNDQKTKLGRISYMLNQKRNNIDKKVELENWRGQMTAILTNGDLIELIHTELFQEMVTNT
jgi:hypothetical protein